MAQDKPNIIVILVDDMGYSDLGAFGGEVETPHIDKLARGGIRFTQNYNSARCCPSRAALLTGLYSHQAGIANFTGRDQSQKLGPAYLGKLNKQCVTLAEVLSTSGYSTYGIGKWHVGESEAPTKRGFDDFYGYIQGHSTSQWQKQNYQRFPKGKAEEIQIDAEDFYATDIFSDYAIEFIQQGQAQKKPFFLYLAHSSPHFPLHAPAETRDRYLDIYRRGWDVLRRERYERQKKLGLVTDSWNLTERSEVPMDKEKIANGFPGQKNPAWSTLNSAQKEDLAYRMATFAAMIEHVDQGIGRMLQHLEKTNSLDNTIILFTSDNGACYEWGPFGFDKHSRKGITTLHQGEQLENIGGKGTYHSVGSGWSCLSNTPLRMYKHFNHEGGNCSPLIAHWPKGIQAPNRWERTPIHLIDIMPTICDASQSNYPKEFKTHSIQPTEGLSLMPLFNNTASLQSRTLYFDHFGSSAVRTKEWKLVRGNTRYNNRQWELYNISNDRCETQNLILQNPEKAKELEKMWSDWAKKVKLKDIYR
jgi:arylsulfatase